MPRESVLLPDFEKIGLENILERGIPERFDDFAEFTDVLELSVNGGVTNKSNRVDVLKLSLIHI